MAAMTARNHKQWLAKPPLEPDEWVDSRIYSDPQIFEEELEKIFKRAWIPVCHESELPKPYDFRTVSVAREPIVICRGPDNGIRAFLNVCPHRGMLIERRPAGSFFEGQPSGNPKRMTCMFHGWQFDMHGNCVYVSREKEGYQERLCKEHVGMRENFHVRTGRRDRREPISRRDRPPASSRETLGPVPAEISEPRARARAA
jgi:methanesulfonate monooxygenase large subunit